MTNGGPDIGEFEILSGTRVVDEAENIIPGFVVNLATHLDGGEYELICYSLQTPRGTLAVTGGGPATVESGGRCGDAERLPGGVRDVRAGQAAELKTQLAPFVAASRPATSRRPRRRTRHHARRGSASSRSPSCSAISTSGWTRARRTSPGRRRRPGVPRLAPPREGPLDRRHDRRAGTDRRRPGRRCSRAQDPARDDGHRAAGDRPRRRRAHRGGRPVQADRRGGSLLAAPTSGRCGQRRGIEARSWTSCGRRSRRSTAPYLAGVDAAFTAVDEVIAKYADGDGYRPFSTVTPTISRRSRRGWPSCPKSSASCPAALGLAA